MRPAGRGGPSVVLRSIDAPDGAGDVALALLTPPERAEADRFLRDADRRRFVAARALLREMLGRATGVAPAALPLRRDCHGKPVLETGGEVAFNVSHSGDFVLVAVGRAAAIGVDIEHHRPGLDIEAVGPLVFTPDEMAAMRTGSPAQREQRFFRQWVIKEALVKALGTGLALEPRRFQILPGQAELGPIFVGPGPDDVGSGWRLAELEAPPGYSAALAWRI